jgi:hypothetical protein
MMPVTTPATSSPCAAASSHARHISRAWSSAVALVQGGAQSASEQPLLGDLPEPSQDRTMIANLFRSYSVNHLRQEKNFRDHVS